MFSEKIHKFAEKVDSRKLEKHLIRMGKIVIEPEIEIIDLKRI